MASITVDSFFLNPASNLATIYQLDVSSLKEDDAAFGEVRVYANGRRRSVVRAGKRKSWSITFDLYDRATLAAIQALKGATVLARDAYGRKMWCVFYAVGIDEVVPVDRTRVSLDLVEITFSEAV